MEGTKRSINGHFLALKRGFLVVLLLLVLAMHEPKMVHGQKLSPRQCREEIRLITNACRAVIFGQRASPGCCQMVRVSHFSCTCPMFTPKLAALVNVNQAIKLLQGCGRRVPRHFKCGSLYFP